MADIPKRRLELMIRVGADSWKELFSALNAIEFRLVEHKESNGIIRCTSGGVGSGWHLEVDTHAEQDAAGYQRDLKQYMADKRVEAPK